jgi:hypothetical protein
MELNRKKSTWLMVALFAPALLTLEYLAATEFPQRPDGPALPLRARGTPESDAIAAIIAIVVGLVGLGVLMRARSIVIFVPLAFFYSLAQLLVIGWVTNGWAWLFRSSLHERMFSPASQQRSLVLASDSAWRAPRCA